MKKRFLSVLLCACMCIPMMPVTASAAANNISVDEISYYDESGDLEGLTIDFGWDTASAPSRLTVMTKKLRSAGESGTNSRYGDFTDYGYYGRSFKNWNEVLNNNSKFGMLYYTDEQTMKMGKTNTITVNFDEGDIPLDENKTYYLYLWTYYGGYYYPDNLFMVLKVKDDKLQYAPATGRNSYGSFTTLWEEVKTSATSTSKPATTTTSKPAASATTSSVKSDINVKVENKDVVWTDAAPFIKDGRTLVPLRPIANALGLTVVWDAEAQQAGFSDGKTTVVFELNSKEYVVFYDEKLEKANAVKMDASAISVNGRTYAPAKYLAQAFGYHVGWNGNTSTVTISKDKVETILPEKQQETSTASMKLDPLPTMHYTKHPDWYGELTPPHKMSDERLLAEYDNLNQFIKTLDERSLPIMVREDDLWKQIMIRKLEKQFYAQYGL